jgi:choline monooxygenase
MPPDNIQTPAAADQFAPPAFMKDAVSLPASAYTDPKIYAREMEACFRKGWISIASAGQVPKHGDVLAIEVIGEPLLVTRDKKDEVRVFYNVCRHRGVKLLADGPSRCSTGIVSCPYHQWSYALDGSFKAAPYWSGAKDSAPPAKEKAGLNLIAVRSAVWCGMVFVDLSGKAEPFDDFIRPLAERWKDHDLSLLRQATLQEWTVPTNWKFAVENFLDIYHLPWIHPELGTAEQSFADLSFTYLSDLIFGYVMPHFDRPRETAEHVPDMFPGLGPTFEYALDIIYVWPNTLMLMAPSWIQTISLGPCGASSTRELLAGFLVGDDMMSGNWAEYREFFGGLLKMVNDQDTGILAGLQQGRATNATNQGVYAPYWDQLAEHFARAVDRAIVPVA